MRVFLSFIFRENSSERLSIRDTLHTFVGEKGARERNGGGDGTFQFPPSLTVIYTRAGGQSGNLGAEDGRTVSGALSWKFRNTRCTRVRGILGRDESESTR